MTGKFLQWFAVGLCIFALSYIFCVTFCTVPKDNVRYADTALGFLLGTVVATIVQFAYGSSLGSRMKDEKNERTM